MDYGKLVMWKIIYFPACSVWQFISVVRCNCKETKKGCCTSARCSCRSKGLKCVSACGYCRGDGCDNNSLCSNGEESDDDDVHGNIF